MEIELFIRETFRNMEFYLEPIESQGCDHSMARMVEKVENGGREEVTCSLCHKLILLPPVFECDSCYLLFHISCLNVEFTWGPGIRYQEGDEYLQTLILHCGSGGHGLISEEKEKPPYYENKQVVCFACKEPIGVSPAYKCSAHHCPLLFHKSCAQLPYWTQHPLHDTNDALAMRLAFSQQFPGTDKRVFPRCNICGKKCIDCIYYSNTTGKFILDFTCAIELLVGSTYDCQLHKFILIEGNFHFTCQLCGNQGQELASQCTICRLFIHGSCRGFPRAIRISRHEHSLTLTFPLRRLKDPHNSSCNICRGKVIAKYAAYCCQVCDFIAHLPCTDSFWLRDEIVDSLLEDSMALVSHDVKEMTLAEIHSHDLILNNEQFVDDKVCDVCMQFIRAPPFYHCVQCSFFIHSACARLPREKRHPLHEHTLTLLSQAPHKGVIFRCDACRRYCNGFTYRCVPCDFDLDVYCCTMPQTLTHLGHEHSLSLAIKPRDSCSACGLWSHFLCSYCDYSLCYKCVTLPLEVRHKHDEHPLALGYAVEDKFNEYYCLICKRKKKSKSFFYYCSECNFYAHNECVYGNYPYIKIGRAYKSDNHKHSLTFVRTSVDSSPNCDACGKPFYNGVALKCNHCKFIVHFPPWWKDCLRKMSLLLREEEDMS